MTVEDAIAWFENRIKCITLPGARSMYEIALSALRAQQEMGRSSKVVESNEPLTLDELRKMDGEPVWIVWLDGRIKSKWWIVGNYDWHMMEFDDDYERCGKTWFAYRQKPEEGQK